MADRLGGDGARRLRSRDGAATGHGAGADDSELVEAARRGDRAALESLLRRHHDRLHLLCRRMCADRGDAEDATQDALIAIVRGLDRYDGRSAFTTWAHRVTVNACLDALRRRARRPMPSEVDPASWEVEAPAATAIDPAESAIASERRATLEAALAQLPEEFRVPVVLRDVADLDYAEIGRLLELAPGTVRSRISRGRARLAALLEPSHGNLRRTADVRTSDEP